MESSGNDLIQVTELNSDEFSNLDLMNPRFSIEDFSGLLDLGERSLDVGIDALDAIDHSRHLYRIELPKGVNENSLVKAKDGSGAVRGVYRDVNGNLNGDVKLLAQKCSPTQLASLGLAAAAMVVGQAYMTEISDSLDEINEKLDTVLCILEAEQKARLVNALDAASRYVRRYDSYISDEHSLMSAHIELERLYNDVTEVMNLVTKNLKNFEERCVQTKAKGKTLESLIRDFHSYEELFNLALKALAALSMTRMYYDGCITKEKMNVELEDMQIYINRFNIQRNRIAIMMESKIAQCKTFPLGSPVSFEQEGRFIDNESQRKRLKLKTPIAAGKDNNTEMRASLRLALHSYENALSTSLREYESNLTNLIEQKNEPTAVITDGSSVRIDKVDRQ